MGRLWTAIALFAVLATARAQDKSEYRVTFELKNHIILVKGSLCGQEGHIFILDSGASETVVTPDAAKKAGLGKGMMTQCPQIAAGDAVAKDLRVVVLDPPQAQPLRQMGVDYSGILGQTYFARFVSTINYQKSEVVFVPADRAPKTEKDDKSFLVDFKLVNNIVVVEGKVNDKGPQTFILDTGASETVITPATAKDVGLKTEPAMTQMGRLEKGTVETIQAGDAVAKAIDVIVWDPPQAMALKMLGVDYNGFLGYSYLAQFLVTLDYRQKQIKLVPVANAGGGNGNGRTNVPSTTKSKTDPFFGMKLKDVAPDQAKSLGLKYAGGAEVVEVAKFSPAEKSGFKKGDILTKVNGLGIVSADEFEKISTLSKTGDRLDVTVVREGGKAQTALKLVK